MVLAWAEHAAIATTVALLIARVLAWRTIKAVWAIAAHHAQIRDLLDTSTPGGLTDVIQAIRDR
jgi:hypothetical protein